jgi:membrane protein implicated in regulation of membrane protease activity
MWGEWWVWGVAAIILAVGEVLLPSFVLLGFAIGAGAVALVLLVGGPLAVWLGGSLPVLLPGLRGGVACRVAGAEEMAGGL